MANLPTRCITNKIKIETVEKDINNLGIKLNETDEKYKKVIWGNGKTGLEERLNMNENKLDKKIATDKILYGVISTGIIGNLALLIKLVFFK